jgi:hypothetical protein
MIEAMLNSDVSQHFVGWERLERHLRSLRSHGCAWSVTTMAAAATQISMCWGKDEDDLVAGEWLLDEGCPYDASACAAAAAAASAFAAAGSGWSLQRLLDLHGTGLPLDGGACVAAAQGCPLDGCADLVVTAAPVREWLLAQGVVCRSA